MGARCHVGDKKGGLKVYKVGITTGRWGHVATGVTIVGDAMSTTTALPPGDGGAAENSIASRAMWDV